MMTVEERATFILDQGPLSRDEARQLPLSYKRLYASLMEGQLERLGPEDFLAQKEGRRKAVLYQLTEGDFGGL